MTTNDTSTNDQGSELAKVQAELAAEREARTKLEASHKAVQRELEKARQRGQDGQATAERLAALEDAFERIMVPTAETVAAVAKEANIENKLAGAVEEHRKRKSEVTDTTKSKQATEAAQTKASTLIVGAADLAGLKGDAFEEAWQSDERFAEARAYWNAGAYDQAASAFQVAVAKPKAKVFTEADVKKAVEEELAKVNRQSAAKTGGASTANAANAIDLEAWRKLPVAERAKQLAQVKAQLAR